MAPIEAEDEPVEIGLQVLPAQPVIDAEPLLRVGEDPMHPRVTRAGLSTRGTDTRERAACRSVRDTTPRR